MNTMITFRSVKFPPQLVFEFSPICFGEAKEILIKKNAILWQQFTVKTHGKCEDLHTHCVGFHVEFGRIFAPNDLRLLSFSGFIVKIVKCNILVYSSTTIAILEGFDCRYRRNVPILLIQQILSFTYTSLVKCSAASISM